MMKRANISSFTILIAILGSLSSCTKEQIKGGVGRPSGPMALITCQVDVDLVCDNTIPHYASIQDFEDAYACLESDYEAHNDAYEALYSTLSDDDFDDQAELDNFNEEETLDDWESNKNYTSLRTQLNAAEDIWLANNMVGPDPLEHAVCDFIFMTLLNSDGDVKIGTVLYHFHDDGSVVSVSDGNCQDFKDAKDNPEFTSSNVTRIFPSQEDSCRFSDNDFSDKPYDNNANRKFYWKVDFDSYVGTSRAKTLARNYRYKAGSWKRAKAKTYVYIGGDVWNNECIDKDPISYKEKTKNRKRVMVRRGLSTLCRIKEEQVQGIVTIIGDGAYIDETIDW